MKHNKVVDVVATIVLATGFVLAFLPHAFHTAIGLSEQTSHVKHVITGMILVVVALAVLVYNNNALKME